MVYSLGIIFLFMDSMNRAIPISLPVEPFPYTFLDEKKSPLAKNFHILSTFLVVHMYEKIGREKND